MLGLLISRPKSRPEKRSFKQLRLRLAVKPQVSASSPIGEKKFAKSCVGTLGFGSARETRHRRDWKDFEVDYNVELLITSQGNDPIPPPPRVVCRV